MVVNILVPKVNQYNSTIKIQTNSTTDIHLLYETKENK